MTLRTPAFSDSATWPAAWDRFALEVAGLQTGVFGANDFKVTPAAAGGQRLDIAAGTLLFKSLSGLPATGISQGLFMIVNDAPIANAITLAASNATLPRLDQIVVRVRDDATTGGGNDAAFLVLTGTATAGATLDSRAGAAALPADHVRIADVLVPASSSAVLAGNVRDRRGWARGANSLKNGYYSGGNHSVSPVSTAIGLGLLSTRLELSGAPVVITFSGRLTGSAGAMYVVVTSPFGSITYERLVSAGGQDVFLTEHTPQPSGLVGSMVFDVMFRVPSGQTGTVSLNSNPPIFTVREMVRQTAVNSTA